MYDNNNLELFASKFSKEIEKGCLESYDIDRCKIIGEPIYGSKAKDTISTENLAGTY